MDSNISQPNNSSECQFNHKEEIIIDYENVSYQHQTKEFFKHLPAYSKNYAISLFPIITWIHRYNLMWLIRDLIAGVTVGIVIVPQSMGYAKIAELPPQYGLYTAFVGLCVYCLFATSKDISIGPTAVMSLLVGQTVTRVTANDSTITGPEIAVSMSLFTGIVAMFIGLVRLGILVDFIPAPAIAGFMSGSAITITIGQLPKLFGIKGINTQDSSYLIFGNFFKYLPNTKVDVVFGLISLIWLYCVRYICQVLGKRYPKYSMHFFFFSIMRNGILVIVGTLVAFLINIGKSTSPISILKTVPPGFKAMGVPVIRTNVLSGIVSSLPSGVIILILEHVAIAKSFGRINDYSIVADQEIIAIGFTNIWASFFGAYPSTGSFSRTAIKARSGVKTPIAGIISALVVLLALYALTPAFYYIPDAVLAAIVIHAVADLVSGPNYVKRLAAISLWELLVFVATVIVTFFTTVEYGIYASVGMSIVILLFRIARPRFWGLGRIPLSTTTVSTIVYDNEKKSEPQRPDITELHTYLYVPENHPSLEKLVESLPKGILMCRIDESLTYPNSGYISDKIINYCKSRTRSGGKTLDKGERPWNDDSTPDIIAARESLPILHALILDFASVNRLDSSGLQAIVDAQNALNRYSGHHVEFHFVNILNPTIRRCLVVAQFGTQPRPGDNRKEILPIVPTSRDGPEREQFHRKSDEESPNTLDEIEDIEKSCTECSNTPPISFHRLSTDGIPIPKDRYPFFHWSADKAVRSALSSLSIRHSLEEPNDTEVLSDINSNISSNH
ncbi:sulfate transporter family-domain-containing protein [Cokeromyces recurvatus]|uniref:sulfate transporter family-domain-containing protein n=1 Tax=Cokeromyces recurvatus TaxID=90255 RepID=UPI00221EC9AC|nr:sulfate transporter family-domain-containing protein [Cokeromyces recurvatus]KAI7902744.1 sulfate transporter family-domain-containing protein [Cokeromyces recurvatus]